MQTDKNVSRNWFIPDTIPSLEQSIEPNVEFCVMDTPRILVVPTIGIEINISSALRHLEEGTSILCESNKIALCLEQMWWVDTYLHGRDSLSLTIWDVDGILQQRHINVLYKECDSLVVVTSNSLGPGQYNFDEIEKYCGKYNKCCMQFIVYDNDKQTLTGLAVACSQRKLVVPSMMVSDALLTRLTKLCKAD